MDWETMATPVAMPPSVIIALWPIQVDYHLGLISEHNLIIALDMVFDALNSEC